MAKNDEWCEFCNEKIKQTSVIINDREFGICGHCSSLIIKEKDITKKGDYYDKTNRKS